MADFCTVVFEYDITKFKGNPLGADTPFGRPFAIKVGNVLDQVDSIEEIEEAAKHLLETLKAS